MDYIISAIKSIRNVRQEMNVNPGRKAKTYILANPEAKEAFRQSEAYLQRLGYATEVVLVDSKEGLKDTLPIVTPGGEIFLPLLDLIDKEQELARLLKDLKKYQGEVDRIEKKLGNEKFMAKAPEAVIDQEKVKLEQYKDLLAKTQKSYDDTKAL